MVEALGGEKEKGERDVDSFSCAQIFFECVKKS